MRVTNNMMTTNLLYNVSKNLEYMSKRQDELATGKKIHRPSDDPVLASKILARRTDLAEIEQYGINTRDALGWLEITEKAIEDNGNIMQRMRELMVQAANGVNTPSDTQKIEEEVKNLKLQLVSNANTTYAGRYVFSGYETDKKLMNEDGTYSIDVDQYTLDNKPKVQYEVSVGESMDVMTNGLDIYGTVTETNIMTTTFNNTTVTGTASSRSKAVRDMVNNVDYTADDFDITIAGTTYLVDESLLDGTTNALTSQEILDVFNNADDGVPANKLSTVADVYFDANNKLVIEAKAYGAVAIAATTPVNYTTTTGVATIEPTITGLSAMNNPLTTALPDPEPFDVDILRNNSINIIVNGVSKKLKPAPSDILVTPADYAAAIQYAANNEFGAGVVTITSPGDVLTISMSGTGDGVEPTLSVDFPKTRTSELMRDIDELMGYLEVGDNLAIGNMLDTVDVHMNKMLSLRADIGARTNRMDMISKKLSSNSVSFTRMLSDAQDADMSEVIMKLKNAENVYKASLSTGARVIQPSLIDFLR